MCRLSSIGFNDSYWSNINQQAGSKTIRGMLREPEDYFDYIDLSELSSFSPENVVASREHGVLNVNLEFVPKI